MNISISTGSLQVRFGDRDAFRIVKDAGFDAVDVSVIQYGHGQLPDVFQMSTDERSEYFHSLRRYVDELGVRVVHTHNLVASFVPDANINQERLHRAKIGLEISSILGAEHSVVHCISSNAWGFGRSNDEMLDENQKMYRALYDQARESRVRIALETFGVTAFEGEKGLDHFAVPERMMEAYEALPDDIRSFCFDSGHTHAASFSHGQMSVPEAVAYFGQRIKLLHLHDNNGYSDQHLLPGMGSIHWPDVFDALDAVGYDGVINYEVRLGMGQHTVPWINFMGAYLRDFTNQRGRLA